MKGFFYEKKKFFFHLGIFLYVISSFDINSVNPNNTVYIQKLNEIFAIPQEELNSSPNKIKLLQKLNSQLKSLYYNLQQYDQTKKLTNELDATFQTLINQLKIYCKNNYDFKQEAIEALKKTKNLYAKIKEESKTLRSQNFPGKCNA
ncbi:hypothetical protein GF322_02545 [Candidatus Dependentiae bacterium]|nr:hypothetical protein [Candidatus Dependentiae bacterium]